MSEENKIKFPALALCIPPPLKEKVVEGLTLKDLEDIEKSVRAEVMASVIPTADNSFEGSFVVNIDQARLTTHLIFHYNLNGKAFTFSDKLDVDGLRVRKEHLKAAIIKWMDAFGAYFINTHCGRDLFAELMSRGIQP